MEQKPAQEAALERFQYVFDQLLPEDSHTEEEEDLWTAVREEISACGDGTSASVSKVSAAPAVQAAKATLMATFTENQSREFTLTMWIKSRLTDMRVVGKGSEAMVLLTDADGNANEKAYWDVHGESSNLSSSPRYDDETEEMLDRWVAAKRTKDWTTAEAIQAELRQRDIEPQDARPPLKSKLKKYELGSETKGKKSKGKGDGSKSKGKGKGKKSKGDDAEGKGKKSKGKGHSSKSKGKGSGHEVERTEFHEGVAQEKMDVMQRQQADFFSSLPEDDFLPEELRLRKCILEEFAARMSDGHEGPLEFSTICNAESVRKAKGEVLPTFVTVATWVAERLGHEIVLGRDESNQATASVAPDVLEEIDFDDTELEDVNDPPANLLASSSMIEFFRGPSRPLEEALREAVYSAVSRREAIMGSSGTDSTPLAQLCAKDPVLNRTWKDAQACWLALDPTLDVTLAGWLELRVRDLIHVSTAPHVTLRSESRSSATASKKRSGDHLSPVQSSKVPRVAPSVAPSVAPELFEDASPVMIPQKGKGKMKGRKGQDKDGAPLLQTSNAGKGKRPYSVFSDSS